MIAGLSQARVLSFTIVIFSDMRIDFAGQSLTLCPEGTVYWAAESMLVVADLHLERAVPPGGRRLFLQPHDTRETLARLKRAVRVSGASRLLFLGDSFRDAEGPESLGLAERDMLEDMCGALQAIWVHGAQGGWVPPRARSCGVFSLGGLTFRHEASPDAVGEISGYLHPLAGTLQQDGCEDNRRCFVEDGRKLVMPSFGDFTNGTDVRDPAFAAHFPRGFTAHVLGMEKIDSLKHLQAA
jgi:metallophosphoesterase superfamily enzyme